MDNYNIISKLYDISANLDCGDIGGAEDSLENLISELEEAG